MKTKSLYIGTCCSFLLSVAASGAPQAPTNQNYIKTRTYCTSNGQTYYDDLQYYDGLGKPYMSVNVNATPSNKDFIALTEYDDLGRKSREWLPVALATTGGYAAPENIKAAALGAGGYNDEMPYVSYVYEDSPDARVLEQRQPGASLQGSRPAAAKAYYLNDSSDSLCCWKLLVKATTRDTAVLNYGLAAPMTLFVTQTYDADGDVAYEFRDARGLQVLTRQKIEAGIYADTYYVYDDSNNLRFVLPPEFSSKIVDDSIFPRADSLLAQYAYIYKYDERNRCVARKLPGADWIYVGYDKTDKPVLMQDGELRRHNRWNITLYDTFGRPAISGLLSGTNLSAGTYKSRAVRAVFDPSATATYCYRTDCGVDLSELQVTEVHYYDDYRHRSSLPAYFGTLGYVSLSGYGTRFGSDTDAVASKGLETGCLYAMLPDIETLLGANYYYDDKNRIIQRRMQTMHGGLYAEDIAYNFTGNILSRRESCQPQSGAATDVLINSYTYDDRGRLLSETASLNRTAGAPYSCSYDDFGRLVSTTQGSGSHAVTTTRQYNIRNWLTSQQNSLFEMSLAYNTPQYSATETSYTGNITEWSWKYGPGDTENTYAFTYDKLSRLTDTKQYVNGAVSDLFVEKNLSYDRNGNIRTLNRTETGELFHAFSYGYTGNQLTTLSDGAADYAYAYDRNGNMTNDGMNGLKVVYNRLNLIEKVLRGDTILVKYSYLSDGTKLSAFNSDGNGLEYHGSLVYKKQGSGISLESAGFTGGRFISTTNGLETYFHLTDHLGSVRVVVGADGEVAERNNYYPFGLRWNDAEQRVTDNRYRYNGKEDQSFAGIPYSDYGARMYDPSLVVWHGMDPLAANYYSISPYVFCADNPIHYVDDDGRKLNPSSAKLKPHLKRVMSTTKTGQRQFNKMVNNQSDITINYVNGYHPDGRTIYGETAIKSHFKDPKTGEIVGGRVIITLYVQAINDRAKELKIDASESEAATLAEEAEHTEAENIKLADRETKEEKKEQEENPDSDGLKYEEKESERLAHQQRDELLREILNEDNKLKL